MLRTRSPFGATAFLCFLLILSSSSSAWGQSAKEALTALKKLAAKVEVGIAYNDYGQALGDTNFAVKEYLDSPEAKKQPELSRLISKAFGRYQLASTIWSMKFERYSRGFVFISSEPGASIWSDLIREYPEMDRDYREGGAKIDTSDIKAFDVDLALSAIWARAEEDVKAASALSTKPRTGSTQQKK